MLWGLNDENTTAEPLELGNLLWPAIEKAVAVIEESWRNLPEIVNKYG